MTSCAKGSSTAEATGTLDNSTAAYVGRFAPTPSGPLHLGSLLTAVASYLDARANTGEWRLRIDDIDTPRIVPEAETLILRALEAHGLFWDGPVAHQSAHADAYRDAYSELQSNGRVFHCSCSRRDLRGTTRYPGTCRDKRQPRPGCAGRVVVDDTLWGFDDLVYGCYNERLSETVGDFVVWRRDDIASYQLAVVVDDHLQGVNHIVRGSDLLDNTARQLQLIDALALARPRYRHVPIIVDIREVKLSKHDAASTIDERFPTRNLASVLQLLGQQLPGSGIEAMSAEDLVTAAASTWERSRIPKSLSVAGYYAI